MRRRSLLRAAAAALVAAPLAACALGPTPETSAMVQIGAIDWYVDYEAALEIAREQDRALWVHFGENPG